MLNRTRKAVRILDAKPLAPSVGRHRSTHSYVSHMELQAELAGETVWSHLQKARRTDSPVTWLFLPHEVYAATPMSVRLVNVDKNLPNVYC